MPITDADVQWWAIQEGISHVVASHFHGWTETLCGRLGPTNCEAASPGKRVCRACREKMKSDDVNPRRVDRGSEEGGRGECSC